VKDNVPHLPFSYTLLMLVPLSYWNMSQVNCSDHTFGLACKYDAVFSLCQRHDTACLCWKCH